ncbi:hypothetical protein QBC42DRAFT_236367 [Cladorrhinum samala]|uniref:TM7S3/TM198-like domain-containing protein n=1 Tax=Cladorrhinum samala TaxID=585594 RepID=A0AAV9HCE3_9PEZI|nr:hypothetical protein QBC42DRAFT_236367 [Cladorrhinum samala]
MRLIDGPRGRALICFCILLSLTLAGALEAEKRQEVTRSTTESLTQTSTSNRRETTAPPESSTRDAQDASTTPTLTSSGSSSLSVTSSSPSETSSINSTVVFDNATLPPDQLPLKPELTPGWGVAGVIMLVTGIVHAVIGIKMKWLHTFFSTGFLASLGTAALILYVMTPPLKDAIQGAYVVAAVCSGAVLGGLAIIFKDVIECLGGILGGFCLSMWLLTLKAGGLVANPTGKIVFIASFTLSGFGFYFLPWTRVRTCGLMACISFSGATVAVLGIDCFSRAGLKEFWAYIWRLNDDLFPLGAATYPLTRGIRVELALTIIIFLAGIVSQLKLWRLIKDGRGKRDEEKAEVERNLRAEEEAIGRQIEENTTRERRQWERVYGDGTSGPDQSTGSSEGDVDSEKRVRASSATLTATARTQSPTDLDGSEVLEIPLDPLLQSSPNLEKDVVETVITKHSGDRPISISVDRVDTAEQEAAISIPKPVKLARRDRRGRRDSTATFGTVNSPPTPASPVLPLPFQPADGKTEEDGRSSFATFANYEDRDPGTTPRVRDSRAENVAKRLSSSSAKLLRSLSQRSARSKKAIIEGRNESHEDLVDSRRSTKDDLDSLIAVLDIMDRLNSDDEPDTVAPAKRLPALVDIDGGRSGSMQDERQTSELQTSSPSRMSAMDSDQQRTDPTAETIPEIPSTLVSLDAIHLKESRPTSVVTQIISPEIASAEEGKDAQSLGPEEAVEEKSTRRASMDSVSASLKKDNLPPALSRVALSYRTNEWAKRLSEAETPDIEDPQVQEAAEAIPDAIVEEPAPLDVTDLQQTAENAQVPPAVTRPVSTMSNHAGNPTASRNNLRTSLTGYTDVLTYGIQPGFSPEPQARSKGPYRSTSMTGMMLKGRGSRLIAEPIAEEGLDGTGEQSTHVSTPFPSETSWTTPPMSGLSPVPHELSASTSFSNLPRSSGLYAQHQPSVTTLLGMREMLLRTKASGTFVSPNSNPDASAYALPLVSSGNPRRPSIEAAGSDSYPSHQMPTSAAIDLDDVPLSQRRAIIRQSSSLSFFSAAKHRASISSLNGSHNSPVPVATAESTQFNSHQPQRRSTAPNEQVRQAQLANFRNSIQADLRSGSSLSNPSGSALVRKMSIGGETNLITGGLLGVNASMASLHGVYNNEGAGGGESVRLSRVLEVDAARRQEQERALDKQKRKKERSQREFEERMRSGQLMEAHRDAMRRMQRAARDL